MKILNVKLQNVTVGFDQIGTLSAGITFRDETSCCNPRIIFNLEKPTDIQRLKKLVEYTGVSDILDLEGKNVRRVDGYCICLAFGHPVKDKFIRLDIESLSEVPVAQLMEIN